MFLGSTSSLRSSGSCWRRQRLRSATATARLASFWPTMKRSSSETISRGEKSVICVLAQGRMRSQPGSARLDGFDHEVIVGVDADFGCDLHRRADDLIGVLIGGQQRARGGERII